MLKRVNPKEGSGLIETPSNRTGLGLKGCVAKIALRRRGQWVGQRLCRYTEQACDELGLPYCIPAVQPFHLPLPHHLRGLNPCNDSLCDKEEPEALTYQLLRRRVHEGAGREPYLGRKGP